MGTQPKKRNSVTGRNRSMKGAEIFVAHIIVLKSELTSQHGCTADSLIALQEKDYLCVDHFYFWICHPHYCSHCTIPHELLD
mmetsp:Transcript_17000/g.34229  ORF Transcript_17000/g.34229 Transcript_17000/m.34229 type:complete len:82 (-) Transcript_17000:1427-1672(-)